MNWKKIIIGIVLFWGIFLITMGLYYAYWNFPIASGATVLTDLQKERTIEIPPVISLSFNLELNNDLNYSLNPKDLYIILLNEQDGSKILIYGEFYNSETKKIHFSFGKPLSSLMKAEYIHYISPGKYNITLIHNFPSSQSFSLNCQIISTKKLLRPLKKSKDNWLIPTCRKI